MGGVGRLGGAALVPPPSLAACPQVGTLPNQGRAGTTHAGGTAEAGGTSGGVGAPAATSGTRRNGGGATGATGMVAKERGQVGDKRGVIGETPWCASTRLAQLIKMNFINRTAAYPCFNVSRLLWSGRKALVRWPLRGLDDTITRSPTSWADQDLGIVARTGAFYAAALCRSSVEACQPIGHDKSIAYSRLFCKPLFDQKRAMMNPAVIR